MIIFVKAKNFSGHNLSFYVVYFITIFDELKYAKKWLLKQQRL